MIRVDVRCDTKLVSVEAHPCETLKSIATKAAKGFGLSVPVFKGFGELSPFTLMRLGAKDYLPGKLTLQKLGITKGPVEFSLYEVRA